MKLRAKDQMHISSVHADSLRPGQEFEVSDAMGADLLKAHPNKLERIGDSMPDEKSEHAPKNKAEPAPQNKSKPSSKKTASDQPQRRKRK